MLSSLKYRFKTLLKLQRQFAHSSVKILIALLKDAGVKKEEYEITLTEKCEICKIYTKTPTRPVEGMAIAKRFNERMAMNLKQRNSHWLLYIIDVWSRYTLSVLLDRKKLCNIMDALMKSGLPNLE